MKRSTAYLVTRFPSVSQTFILNEIVELEKLGWHVELFPMIREAAEVAHPHAGRLVEQANYRRIPSLECVRAHLFWAKAKPRTYLRALVSSVRLAGWHINSLKAFWSVVWAVMIASEIERSTIRHLHAHWATFPAHAAMVISALTGRTFSFTAHAHDIYSNAYGLEEKVSAAAFVVTISELNREILTQVPGANEKVKVIRCGVDLNRFVFHPPKRGSAANLRILTVGSLEEKKGHRYLLEACRLLKAQGVSVECRIVGSGPERARLEHLSQRLDLSDRAIFLGALNSTEVAAEMASADIFVMPSIVAANRMMEGIPVALMEAMATGLPVIASKISGIPELVEDGVSGILVPEKDPRALARAICAYRNDFDLCVRLGMAARSAVVERYDLQMNTQKLARELEAAILSE
ncbi:glycosyltransferase [Mycolicibacterium elephantis]|uniref:glycosyltransferase n=1 Tax=Mycolicibacterium elephantis TaxID=81858 RepID=UPI0009ED8A81|nr:glycosyltransferase [Mycolicibacterium elephantis]